MCCYSLVFILIAWGARTPHPAPLIEVCRIAAAILPATLLAQLGFFALYRAMRGGPHSVAWSISQAAMILPFISGWLVFGNPVGALRVVGILLMLLSLPLLGKGKAHGSTQTVRAPSFIYWCVTAFLLIGLGQALTLVPNEWKAISPAALSWRVPLFSIGGVWWWGYMIYTREKFCPGRIRPGILYGGAVAAGQVVLYLAIDRMSLVQAAEIVYPLAVGCCIVLFFAYCLIFRKERCSIPEATGLFLLLGGMIFLAV